MSWYMHSVFFVPSTPNHDSRKHSIENICCADLKYTVQVDFSFAMEFQLREITSPRAVNYSMEFFLQRK